MYIGSGARSFFERIVAGIAQLVEHDLAKVGVAGSSPVSRSTSQTVMMMFVTVFFVLNIF